MDRAGISKPLLIAEKLWIIDGFWELESQFYLRTLVGQLWSKVVQEYIANTNSTSWVIKEKEEYKVKEWMLGLRWVRRKNREKVWSKYIVHIYNILDELRNIIFKNCNIILMLNLFFKNKRKQYKILHVQVPQVFTRIGH